MPGIAPRVAEAFAAIHAAIRAFSGEVETGSPQKMRSRKDNWSEVRFHWNGIRSSSDHITVDGRREPVNAVDRGGREIAGRIQGLSHRHIS